MSAKIKEKSKQSLYQHLSNHLHNQRLIAFSSQLHGLLFRTSYSLHDTGHEIFASRLPDKWSEVIDGEPTKTKKGLARLPDNNTKRTLNDYVSKTLDEPKSQ